MKLSPKIFLAGFDCGCGGGTSSSSDLTTGFPGTGSATWCDNRFANLPTTSRLNIFGVAPGSNCAGRFTAKRGFLFDDGGGSGQFITDEPVVSLTRVNPISEGAYPAIGTWPAMVCAVGTDPLTWRFVQAPTAGKWRVESDGGVFKFVDASVIPGLDAVCSLSSVANVALFGCYKTGDDTYSLKKLNTPKDRVIVGVEDLDGNKSVKSLPDADPLQHPKIQPTTLQSKQYVATNPASVATPQAPYAGGLALPADEEITMADCELVVYSTTKKQFFKAPARLKNNVKINNIPGITVGLTSGFVDIGAGNLDFGAVTVNYPSIFVSFDVQTDTAERITYGLFIDGVQVHEWTYTNASGAGYSSPTLHNGSVVINGVALGSRSIKIKVKGTTGSSKFEYTNCNLVSLP